MKVFQYIVNFYSISFASLIAFFFSSLHPESDVMFQMVQVIPLIRLRSIDLCLTAVGLNLISFLRTGYLVMWLMNMTFIKSNLILFLSFCYHHKTKERERSESQSNNSSHRLSDNDWWWWTPKSRILSWCSALFYDKWVNQCSAEVKQLKFVNVESYRYRHTHIFRILSARHIIILYAFGLW